LLKKKFCKKSAQKIGNKNCLWRRKRSFKVAGFLIFLMVSLMFINFPYLSAGSDIDVILSVEPLLDKYGHVSMNADDTFYPCDCFEIVYRVGLSGEFVFETAEFTYDSSVFSMFDSNNLGSTVGSGLFEVLSSAPAGTYQFCVTVLGYISKPNPEPDWEPESFVVAEAWVSVEVVMYNPHFTVTLAYTIPSGSGSSYDKPFALIVRYDGNGPNYNLNQRAIIDDYMWEGYAQKLPETSNLQQALTPNLTVGSFLNQSSNVQFLTQGITTKISQHVLNVDGKNYLNSELPQAFLWETNTNHTYVWTKTLSVDVYGCEWFEWQASITFPPVINSDLGNQALSQEDLQNQLLEQINSPNGTLTTTPFGNTVTALYTRNKDLEQIAKDAGVGKNQTLTNLTPTPIYFTAQERYAKLQYQLDPKVAKEIAVQNFTSSLYYNLTIGCDLFGMPRYFEANFMCDYEFFDKLINVTAYKWNPTLQNWIIDNTVTIDAAFESALNITVRYSTLKF